MGSGKLIYYVIIFVKFKNDKPVKKFELQFEF